METTEPAKAGTPNDVRIARTGELYTRFFGAGGVKDGARHFGPFSFLLFPLISLPFPSNFVNKVLDGFSDKVMGSK